MTPAQGADRTAFESAVHRAVTAWALLGGLVLVGVVLINTYSILSAAAINKPFPGDFELTEMGAAIAAFCFLPYCQITGANVSADIFTMRAGPRAKALMSGLAALIAIAFSALLLWCMGAGIQDYREYEEFTGILEVPIWWAFVPALISLALLALAAICSMMAAMREMSRAGSA